MNSQANTSNSMLTVDPGACDGCGACLAVCPEDALILPERPPEIILERCTLCAKCLIICPVKAFKMDRP